MWHVKSGRRQTAITFNGNHNVSCPITILMQLHHIYALSCRHTSPGLNPVGMHVACAIEFNIAAKNTIIYCSFGILLVSAQAQTTERKKIPQQPDAYIWYGFETAQCPLSTVRDRDRRLFATQHTRVAIAHCRANQQQNSNRFECYLVLGGNTHRKRETRRAKDKLACCRSDFILK